MKLKTLTVGVLSLGLVSGCATAPDASQPSGGDAELPTLEELRVNLNDSFFNPQDFIDYASKFIGEPGMEELPALLDTARSFQLDKDSAASIDKFFEGEVTLDACRQAYVLLSERSWSTSFWHDWASREFDRNADACSLMLEADILQSAQTYSLGDPKLEEDLLLLYSWDLELAFELEGKLAEESRLTDEDGPQAELDEGENSSSSEVSEEEQAISTSQRNAIRKAESYLSLMPFSHAGLVKQLEFEGFSASDASFAVDSLDVDWKKQAAKKASDYLELMAFSRQGLIDQLLFDGFTQSQAEYGVGENGY